MIFTNIAIETLIIFNDVPIIFIAFIISVAFVIEDPVTSFDDIV